MLQRNGRLLIGLSGIFGTIFLGLYFGVGLAIGLAQLPASASLSQVLQAGTQYHTLLFIGAWLQATGALLSVIFFLALVHRSKATTRLSGLVAIVGSAILVSVVLLEGVMTIDLAQAAVDGHQMASLTSFDLMTVFVHVYPVVPAPLIFLALGFVLLRSPLLPPIFSRLAIGLGVAFEIAGFIGLFIPPILTIVVLTLQAIWVLAASIAWLTSSRVLATYTDNLSIQSGKAV